MGARRVETRRVYLAHTQLKLDPDWVTRGAVVFQIGDSQFVATGMQLFVQHSQVLAQLADETSS